MMGGVPASNLAGSSAGGKSLSVDFADHAPSAGERWHGLQQLLATIENPDAVGGKHLVAAESQEIDAERGHVDRLMRDCLGAVHEHHSPDRMRPTDDLFDGSHCSQYVGNGRDCQQTRAF